MSGNIPVLKIRFSFIVLFSLLFAASADNRISISGTVKNGEGGAIATAKVSLLSDTMQQSNTNANGEFIISNTAVVNLGAKPAYQFLQAEENLGVHFREGSHGMTSEDWTALLDFADQKY